MNLLVRVRPLMADKKNWFTAARLLIDLLNWCDCGRNHWEPGGMVGPVNQTRQLWSASSPSSAQCFSPGRNHTSDLPPWAQCFNPGRNHCSDLPPWAQCFCSGRDHCSDLLLWAESFSPGNNPGSYLPPRAVTVVTVPAEIAPSAIFHPQSQSRLLHRPSTLLRSCTRSQEF